MKLYPITSLLLSQKVKKKLCRTTEDIFYFHLRNAQSEHLTVSGASLSN